MTKKFSRAAALLLALTVILSLSGCGVTVDEVMNVIAPTEAPVLTAEELGLNQQPEVEEIQPLHKNCGQIDGIFSPFWAESEGDRAVVEMTQLSLLAKEGQQSPTEISRATNEDGSTTVTVRLRDGITFSDGQPVTARDLMFTYYVLLDSDYDGPGEQFKLPIRGLSEYWNGMETSMYAKYVTLYDETYNLGKYDEDLQKALKDAQDQAAADGIREDRIQDVKEVREAQKALDDYDTDKAQAIRDTVLRYWQEDAQLLVDYCVANYSSSIESKTGYTREEVQTDPALQVVFAMVDTGYGKLDEAGVLTGSFSGKTWDLVTAFPTADDFFQEMYDSYDGEAEQYWSIEGYGRKSILELAQNELVTMWAMEDEEWAGAVNSVSGIRLVDDSTLEITLEFCDETILQALCDVYVAPMHIYGLPAQFSPANDSFGFTRGDLTLQRDTKTLSLGAGEFIFRECVGKTAYLDANPNYWLGAPEVPGAELVSK